VAGEDTEKMSQPNIYYVRSGRIGPGAPLYVVFAGGIAGAILAALYALVVCYNPFVYFSCIATLVFGALIGLIAAQSAQAGRSRSLLFNLLAALWLSLFSLWVHWLIWVMLKIEHGRTVAGHLAMSGIAGWRDFFLWLSTNYHLSLSRYIGSHSAEASTEQMLWTWSLEAIIVVVVALLAAWMSTDMEIYSERTGKWAKTELTAEVAGIDMKPDMLRRELESGDFSMLKKLSCIDPAEFRMEEKWKNLELRLIAEPGDESLRAITVYAVDNRLGSNRKRRKSKEAVVRNLLMPLPEYDALLAHLRSSRDTLSFRDARDESGLDNTWPKDN
jgi:hypothetical protein